MKTYVTDIQPGSLVEEVFIAAEKSVKTRGDGSPFLSLVLADKTGQAPAVVWDNVQALSAAFSAGDFVRVQALAQDYRGALQFKIKDLRRLDPAEVDPGDFLPVSRQDPQQTFAEIRRTAQSLTAPHLRRLFDAMFSDTRFTARFCRAPGAKLMHHAYLGGLVEHTFSVATLAQSIAVFYNSREPCLNRDILVAGALLHDIGKMEEFIYDTRIDLSEKGRLEGHIVLGVSMLESYLRDLPDFPDEDALLLRHMIVSHHGTRENGSPEVPRTLEALLLHMADDMDAKFWGARVFMEGDPGDGPWTAWNKPFSRFFYKGGGERTGGQ